MKTSDFIVKCLENEGVKWVFGVPGEENEDLLFSLEKSKQIKFIPTRHEQGAAFIANVYGRLTGSAGVCLATLGPGATNLITGVADAQLDKSPLVAITGQGDLARLHKESHQLLDIVSMFKPIVKWNTSIHSPEVVAEIVRKAFKLAEMEKPGATHFELPEDVAKLEFSKDDKPLPKIRLRRAGPDYKAIMELVKVLKEAKRPVIIAGNGAIRKLASKHLREFVSKTGIPVVPTFMGKGAVSDKDEHSLITMGLKGRDHTVEIFEQADLVICVGYDIAEIGPERWNPKKDKKIVHIDFLPAEVYEYYPVSVEIVCDISGVFWELNKIVQDEEIKFDTKWYAGIRKKILNDIESYSNKKVTVPNVLNIIRKSINDEDILISDVGSHKMWIARNYLTYEPNTCIMSNGLASMGIALPGGIAAKLACPNKNVVCVMGDGGFMMNSQEIETAKRIGANYVIVVLNDNDYGLISWKQSSHVGKSFGTKLTNPDFKKYAESFGIKAYHPKNVDEVEKDLRKAISSNELCLVTIDIDPSVNLELSKKLNGGK